MKILIIGEAPCRRGKSHKRLREWVKLSRLAEDHEIMYADVSHTIRTQNVRFISPEISGLADEADVVVCAGSFVYSCFAAQKNILKFHNVSGHNRWLKGRSELDIADELRASVLNMTLGD